MTPVTRVCALPDLNPRAVPPVLHEWPCDIPYIPEGGLFSVGGKVYRVRYRDVAVDEERGTVTVTYIVQDAREQIRI